jgi:hypothetical protein
MKPTEVSTYSKKLHKKIFVQLTIIDHKHTVYEVLSFALQDEGNHPFHQ